MLCGEVVRLVMQMHKKEGRKEEDPLRSGYMLIRMIQKLLGCMKLTRDIALCRS